MPHARFNHIALTVPDGSLSTNREPIENFYGGILGAQVFEYGDSSQALIISFDEGFPSQSIVLNEGKHPMVARGEDHLGLEYSEFSEVDEIIRSCWEFKESDDRIQIGEIIDQNDDGYKYRACYVKYLLPLQLDIQSIQWSHGRRPKRWVYVD